MIPKRAQGDPDALRRLLSEADRRGDLLLELAVCEALLALPESLWDEVSTHAHRLLDQSDPCRRIRPSDPVRGWIPWILRTDTGRPRWHCKTCNCLLPPSLKLLEEGDTFHDYDAVAHVTYPRGAVRAANIIRLLGPLAGRCPGCRSESTIKASATWPGMHCNKCRSDWEPGLFVPNPLELYIEALKVCYPDFWADWLVMHLLQDHCGTMLKGVDNNLARVSRVQGGGEGYLLLCGENMLHINTGVCEMGLHCPTLPEAVVPEELPESYLDHLAERRLLRILLSNSSAYGVISGFRDESVS